MNEQEIKDIICQAITNHNLLNFYYESGSGKYWRKVEPYLLANRKEGEKKVTLLAMFIQKKGKQEKIKTIIRDNFL
jgi:hypothetical protein